MKMKLDKVAEIVVVAICLGLAVVATIMIVACIVVGGVVFW